MTPTPRACIPARRTPPRGSCGARFLSRVAGGASRLGGVLRALARLDQFVLELLLLLPGEHRVGARRRQVVDRRIGGRGRRALRYALGEAAGGGRHVIGDEAAGAAS